MMPVKLYVSQMGLGMKKISLLLCVLGMFLMPHGVMAAAVTCPTCVTATSSAATAISSAVAAAGGLVATAQSKASTESSVVAAEKTIKDQLVDFVLRVKDRALQEKKADLPGEQLRANSDTDSMERAMLESNPPPRSLTCPSTNLERSISQLQALLDKGVKRLFTVIGQGSQGVSKKSTIVLAAKAYDACMLGFLDLSDSSPYLNAATKFREVCTNPPSGYVHADLSVGSLLDRLQMPLPDKTHSFTRNGRVYFYSNTDTLNAQLTENAAGLGKELDWIAAYKYCENLNTMADAPPLGAPGEDLTQEVVAAVMLNRSVEAKGSLSWTQCIKSLIDRTACRRDSWNTFKESGSSPAIEKSCFAYQQRICHWIKDKQVDGGLGITMEQDDFLATALANCDTEGLSMAVVDKIMAYRCQDTTYRSYLIHTYNAEDLEVQLTQVCPKLVEDYSNKMQDERDALVSAVVAQP
jgi:hypothetical protein